MTRTPNLTPACGHTAGLHTDRCYAPPAAPADIRIPLTSHQADWLADLAASGSESYARALDAGARIEATPGGAETLVIPPDATQALGLAVGIRADIASEGEYTIGMRASILGLSRKLAAAGITSAAPLTEAGVFGPHR